MGEGSISRVAVYSLTRGDPRVEFVGSTYPLMSRPDISHISLHPTLYLDHGRSECVQDFLGNDRGDWMLFIDDDTQFASTALDRLFLAAANGPVGVYGGIYWSPCRGTTDPTNDVFPVVFERQAGQREMPVFRDNWVYKPFPRAWTAEQVEPFEADAVGTGFMLIPKQVLVSMAGVFPGPLKWFQMDVLDGVASGEDLVFCHRAKQDLKYPVIAVPLPDDSIYHIKVVKIGKPTNLPKG